MAQAVIHPRVSDSDRDPPHARQLLQPGSGVFLHPGGGARLLHGAEYDEPGEPEPGTGRRPLARGGRLRHGVRHLGHALHRDARLQPAHSAALRASAHRPLPGPALAAATASSAFALWRVSRPRLPGR